MNKSEFIQQLVISMCAGEKDPYMMVIKHAIKIANELEELIPFDL